MPIHVSRREHLRKTPRSDSMPNQGRIHMRPRLKLFTGEEETFDSPPMMTISFGELMRIVDEAVQSKRAWMTDFSHDDVMITEDLYEVLTEYARLRPGA